MKINELQEKLIKYMPKIEAQLIIEDILTGLNITIQPKETIIEIDNIHIRCGPTVSDFLIHSELCYADQIVSIEIPKLDVRSNEITGLHLTILPTSLTTIPITNCEIKINEDENTQ